MNDGAVVPQIQSDSDAGDEESSRQCVFWDVTGVCNADKLRSLYRRFRASAVNDLFSAH